MALLRLAPWLFPFAVAVYSPVLLPARSTLTFFSLAAQVIPVLLLVLAVEARVARQTALAAVWSGGGYQPTEAFFLVFAKQVYGALIVLYLSIAEVEALVVVANNKPSDGYATLVLSAILAGLAAIVVLALIGWSTAFSKDDVERQESQEPGATHAGARQRPGPPTA